MVRLDLTGEEAGTLKAILEHVGGHPSTSARKYANSILSKVIIATQDRLPYCYSEFAYLESRNELYFKEFGDEMSEEEEP